MIAWQQLIITSLVALFPIVNPIGAIPLFLSLTEGHSEEQQSRLILKTCLYVLGILALFLIAGHLIMTFFRITIPGIRIAGGLILFRTAQGMLQGQPKYQQTDEERTESLHKTDISFTPLAMPTLSGPGAISVTLGLTSHVVYWYDYVAILTAIVAVSLSCWLILRASTSVSRVLGVTGLNVITRMMGFLLLCVSVQFIINGILSVVADPALLRQIVETLRTLP